MLTAITYLPWLVFIVAAISLSPLFERLRLDDKWTIVILAGIVIALVQGENVILGPMSRHEFGDGERLYFGYFPYLAKHSDDLFLTSIAGGVDRYAFGRIGVEWFSLRLEMARFMPLWAVLDFFRIVVPAIAFAGVWLFSTRLLATPREVAFAVAALYAVAFDYTATLTFLYGFDVAAIPFLLFVFFGMAVNFIGLLILVVTIVVFVSAADPFYFWPILLAVSALTLLWIRPRSWLMLLGGLTLLSVVWLVNYAEAIFAFLLMLPHSARGLQMQNAGIVEGIAAELLQLAKLTINYNRGTLSVVTPLILAAGLSIRARRFKYLLIILIPVMGELLSVFLATLPWPRLNLGFLATYRWYVEYGADSLALLVLCGAAALRHPNEEIAPRRVGISTAAIIGAVALAHVTYFRLQQVGHTAVRGNLTAFEQVFHLDPDHAGMKPGYRIVSLPSRADPNVAAGAGLETYDAGATLIHRGLFQYWRSGIEKKPGTITTAQAGFSDQPAYNSCCEPLQFGDYADINLLRVANVGYILSYRDLSDPQLQKIVGPVNQLPRGLLQQMFGSPAPLFVYAIRDPLPRAYAASGISMVSDDAPVNELLDRVKRTGMARTVTVYQSDSRLARSKIDASVNVSATSVINGYQLRLSPHGGALVIVNVPYYPWWHAQTPDGAELELAAANLVQTAVVVPENVTSFRLIYQRPTLFSSLRAAAFGSK